ncbi:hypothetical protein [Xanthovirga aplysinae]|uniref:hypothetical protein n=1 Tax=Xanthovirga aplysinae TaxID=2529853 RepID=UPI0012BBA955|nr:hypothetical protein [Xanthovirga aplysinae]MTI29844.1 hypothetical protein [Xanthovirga aplysinae]
MKASANLHIESARLQQEIESYLGVKAGDLVFEYQNTDDNKVKLDLITINPRHNQSFLYHSTLGYDKLDALNQMLEYIKVHKEKENSYTVQWTTIESNELHTSYFRAGNVYEALDKLYYGRDINSITVFSVVLNPIS